MSDVSYVYTMSDATRRDSFCKHHWRHFTSRETGISLFQHIIRIYSQKIIKIPDNLKHLATLAHAVCFFVLSVYSFFDISHNSRCSRMLKMRYSFWDPDGIVTISILMYNYSTVGIVLWICLYRSRHVARSIVCFKRRLWSDNLFL